MCYIAQNLNSEGYSVSWQSGFHEINGEHNVTPLVNLIIRKPSAYLYQVRSVGFANG